MSVALYIVLENNSDIDTFVDGKALSQCEPVLSQIASDAGVKPLLEFYGAGGEEYAELFEDAEIELPKSQWFGAAEGLQTVRALLADVEQNPAKFPDGTFPTSQDVLTDLKNVERILAEAEKRQIGWYLAIDF
jgi:hypothetical protein